jgi:hypothetical protein
MEKDLYSSFFKGLKQLLASADTTCDGASEEVPFHGVNGTALDQLDVLRNLRSYG